MASTHFNVLVVTFFSFFTLFGLSLAIPNNLAWWCNHTPHPEPCRHYMTYSRRHYAPTNRAEFRIMTVQAAMDRAVHAMNHVMKFGPSCNSEYKKSAWFDCLKLYDNTLFQLNRTVIGLTENRSCSDFDAQTWLSTALTNIQTCQTGSADLKVSGFINPIVSNTNLSELVSNALAINGAFLGKGYRGRRWFLRRERRLLVEKSSSWLMRRANVKVAQDGSGNFNSVQAAINYAAKRGNNGRFIIYVKAGVYKENCEVGNNNNNIILVGDGIKHTIITSSRSVGDGYTTYSSATFGVDGLRFMAVDLTISNTAGPRKGQAVALRSASDLSVFYRVAIIGYQDTLMVHSQRQFYKNCYIYGTIDFIFGNAAVVIQNSYIYARRPLYGQANVITAQGRNDPYQNTGISIHNCRILPASDLKPVIGAVKTYLGRPWQQYSRTVVMKSYMGNLISPEGWAPWENTQFGWDTLYYGEYRNYGPGSNTRNRVKWNGFHVITSETVATTFTVNRLIAGDSWLPNTGVPFDSGL
ncbi:hypothetical protein ACFE04_027271 [Oxalis oulophora]